MTQSRRCVRICLAPRQTVSIVARPMKATAGAGQRSNKAMKMYEDLGYAKLLEFGDPPVYALCSAVTGSTSYSNHCRTHKFASGLEDGQVNPERPGHPHLPDAENRIERKRCPRHRQASPLPYQNQVDVHRHHRRHRLKKTLTSLSPRGEEPLKPCGRSAHRFR